MSIKRAIIGICIVVPFGVTLLTVFLLCRWLVVAVRLPQGG